MLYNALSFISLERHKNRNVGYILKLKNHPTWLGRLLGREPRIITLAGRGTVWHYMPSGRSASTAMEMIIVEMLEAMQYNGRIESYY